jgi:hypothetical protein
MSADDDPKPGVAAVVPAPDGESDADLSIEFEEPAAVWPGSRPGPAEPSGLRAVVLSDRS